MVEKLCSDLIKIDTTNYGEGKAEGEREAAEYVATVLDGAGVEARILESAPRRANVIAHVPGEQRGNPLLIHGHLDVVPADAADWRIPPFAGEVHDGCIWGRGAVDMKGAVAMTLALVRQWAEEGRRPSRDLILAFVADEESTGEYGARFLIDRHREHFDGCAEAISESGGFSVVSNVPGGPLRLYPIAVGERGTAWMRLTARGTAGHGSKPAPDNAVAKLVRALARLSAHEWPVRLTPGVRALLDGLGDALGTRIDHDRLDEEIVRLGAAGRLLSSTIRNSANPTMLDAGYKVNVVPSAAHASVDGRFLPGHREEFFETLDRLLGPEITREFISFQDATSASHSSTLFHDMCAAVQREDHMGRPIPYVMSGGTDAKAFAQIGIQGYGFTPLLLGADLDYFGMFHGVDERVPAEALRFGVRVLDRLLSKG